MDKNGGNRGGARPGAGRKRKPLAEKLLEGKMAQTMAGPDSGKAEMPEVKDYLRADQKFVDLHAEEIFKETWEWLDGYGCAQLVNRQLLEEFALNATRWRQMEECVSDFGPLVKHPTTGQAIASPFVAMAQAYLKSTNYLWQQIYQIVRENSRTACGESFDEMDALLNGY